jgi:biotin-(acetyl-CoA carboxylase) ligase
MFEVGEGTAAIDLPPGYTLIALREQGDAMAHACRIASARGAGTLVWVRRADIAEFAVVLEPEEALATARRALYAGMNALADALAIHCPPERPLTFDWPDALRLDGGLLGGGALAWPEGAAEDRPPDWLVFGAAIRLLAITRLEAGAWRVGTALESEGFESLDAGALLAGFAPHLMVQFDTWRERGFTPIAEAYLARLVRAAGTRCGLDANGDLLMRRENGRAPVERRALAPRLATPSWRDPASGEPLL